MSLKFLFLPLSLMLSIVILIWMAKPQWDILQAKKVELATAEDELETFNKQLASLETSYIEYDSLAGDKELIVNAIPGDLNKDRLIAELYESAKQAGIILVGVKTDTEDISSCKTQANASGNADLSTNPGLAEGTETAASLATPVAPAACLETESFSMEVTGEYLNIRSFIGLVEKMNRYNQVVALEVTKETKNEEVAESQPDQAAPVSQVSGIKALLKINIYSKQYSDIKLAQVLNTPAAKNLMNGKIDNVTVERYKKEITTKTFTPASLDLAGAGRPDIFNK